MRAEFTQGSATPILAQCLQAIAVVYLETQPSDESLRRRVAPKGSGSPASSILSLVHQPLVVVVARSSSSVSPSTSPVQSASRSTGPSTGATGSTPSCSTVQQSVAQRYTAPPVDSVAGVGFSPVLCQKIRTPNLTSGSVRAFP